jgi:hypothetical protein
MSAYFIYKIRKIEEPHLPIKDGFPVFVTIEDMGKQVIKEKFDAFLLRRKFIPAFELTEESLKKLVNENGVVSFIDTNGQTIHQVEANDSITSIAINAQGSELAVGRRDGSVMRFALP